MIFFFVLVPCFQITDGEHSSSKLAREYENDLVLLLWHDLN